MIPRSVRISEAPGFGQTVVTFDPTSRGALAYVAAQLVGAVLGVFAAHAMFAEPILQVSTKLRDGPAQAWSEFVATFGLLVIILGVVRAGRASVAAFAVGGYIAAAYWFTSSTSFANPAVTIGRSLTDTFAGIAPSNVPIFIAMQIIGALIAVGLGIFLFPGIPATDLVVPHKAPDTT